MAAGSIALVATSPASAAGLPDSLSRQLPAGYTVLLSANSSFGQAGHSFYVVALAARTESKTPQALITRPNAPPRPLLIYDLGPDGRYVLKARNDRIVLPADAAGLAGNGCDPLEGGRIATKGRYFTVEGEVACGAHWTDYVTFRLDERSGRFVFDNWRFQSWSFNRSQDPNAEALLPDRPRVVRASKGKATPFETWRRP